MGPGILILRKLGETKGHMSSRSSQREKFLEKKAELPICFDRKAEYLWLLHIISPEIPMKMPDGAFFYAPRSQNSNTCC